MEHGLAAWRSLGGELWRPCLLALTTLGYCKTEQYDKALVVMDEAMATIEKTGERHYEAELYRLKGELLSASPGDNHVGAEACFREAIGVARGQGAKSWELRAVMSLSRLLQQQGKAAEARTMLAEIYNWFTEGLDTPDLQEAKTMLEEPPRN